MAKSSYMSRLTIFGDYAERLGRRRLTIRLKPGVNLLVGPNGSGKSTIIDCLRWEVLAKEKKDELGGKLKNQRRYASWDYKGPPLGVLYFDFEKDNPRVSSPSFIDDLASIRRMQRGWFYKKKSHGEFTRDVLADLDTRVLKANGKRFVVIDEPEQALDLGGMRLLHELLARPKPALAQAVIATHHPFLMASPAFNIVELKKGYHREMMMALQSAGAFARWHLRPHLARS
jgi:predicted ATPase